MRQYVKLNLFAAKQRSEWYTDNPSVNMTINTDISPSAPGQSINPPPPPPPPAEEEEEEEKKSETLQSDTKPEYSVCQQTHNVQGRKRAKTTLPTIQYPTQ